MPRPRFKDLVTLEAIKPLVQLSLINRIDHSLKALIRAAFVAMNYHYQDQRSIEAIAVIYRAMDRGFIIKRTVMNTRSAGSITMLLTSH